MKQNEKTTEKVETVLAHSKTIEELEKELETDSINGLSSIEAKKRLDKYGLNKLEESKKTPFLIKFLNQFKEPMVIVLLLAALISLVIFIINIFLNKKSDEYIDCIVILAIVLINALIGSIQEQKAEQSLDALKKLSTPMCTVKRDGKLINIKSEEVVIGDLVILEEGNITPADLRLVTSFDMKSDEASLTGESLPSEKNANIVLNPDALVADRKNLVYSSCPISYGRGSGICYATSMNTEVGKIAKMLSSNEDDETPLQKKLAALSKQLGIICLIIVILTFLAGFIWAIVSIASSPTKDWSTLGTSTLELFEESIALAVAAIPEGLSAIVTIALALGVSKMVKVNTIVRKLPSVETLGSVTVICSDKTGTLTQNKMTIKKVYVNNTLLDTEDSLNNEDYKFLAKGMMLCSNASIKGDRYGDPTELALLDYAKLFSLEKEEIESNIEKRIDELPFDSVRKMMSVKIAKNSKKIIYTKGALDSILKHTTKIYLNGKIKDITKDDIKSINDINSTLSSSAFRVLAFAYKEIDDNSKIEEENLIFYGLVGMIDPEREEAKPAVKKLKEAGIRTIMITGDHKDTAFAIAKNLSIANDISECISGEELSNLTIEELQEKVKTTNVFARVSPTNKVQIVKALKANDNIVAMTGDGVNDAPSLKIADIGIAMGITGTDVAKDAADMVLTDDNFSSIEKAVEEGRGIFNNVKKSILYLLSSNFGEVFTMFITLLLGFASPLATLQILWINLITDSLPAIALSMDAKEKDIMKKKPRNPKDGIFAQGGLKFCIEYGVIIFLITFSAYLIPALMYSNSAVGQSLGWNQGWNGFVNCLNSKDINGMYVGIKNMNEITSIKLFESESALNAVQFTEGYLSVHEKCQTFAFTVLALSQLFHMIGITDTNRSFIHIFKEKNYMLLISFIVGILLQILVTEVDPISLVFSTTKLDINEWLILLPLAITTLIYHEFIVLIKHFNNKAKSNNDFTKLTKRL